MIRKSPWHHHWNSTKTQALFRSRWWSRTTVGRYYLHGVHFSNLKYLGTEGVIRYWMDVEGGGYVLMIMRNVFQNPEPVATRLDDLHVTWTREVIHNESKESKESKESDSKPVFICFLVSSKDPAIAECNQCNECNSGNALHRKWRLQFSLHWTLGRWCDQLLGSLFSESMQCKSMQV